MSVLLGSTMWNAPVHTRPKSSCALITFLPHATEVRFKIRSFRSLSNDAKKKYVPKDSEPNLVAVRHVDITKTLQSFECP
ncbi:hypothetical protein BKA83DRAFT_4211579 [Pisolithus microcarpus]|nr:hypothetical protein BKA83DRAFT_4211579 [Pisolithus microcarpus]